MGEELPTPPGNPASYGSRCHGKHPGDPALPLPHRSRSSAGMGAAWCPAALPSPLLGSFPPSPSHHPAKGPFPRESTRKARTVLAPLTTRSVVERYRFLPDMVPFASSRLLETASVHLCLRPRQSRLPGPVSPPRPGPGSSGRPRHQKAAATAARPCPPTGRSRLRLRVASAGDRGSGR